MMNLTKLKSLILQEVKIQNKSFNILKYTILYILLCGICTAFINENEDSIKKFGIIFSIISVPLILNSITHQIIKPNYDNGTLDFALISVDSGYYVTIKYVATCINIIGSYIICLPIITLYLNLTYHEAICLFSCICLLSLICTGLSILIAITQCYFSKNTNYLSLITMPIIIPQIILAGLVFESSNPFSLYLIIIGTALISTSISLFLANLLLLKLYEKE